MDHAPAREKNRRRWLPIPIAALYLVPAYGAAVVFFSADGTARWREFWRWSSAIRYDRLFKAIQ